MDGQNQPRWREWFDHRTLEVVREEWVDENWKEISRTFSPDSGDRFRPKYA